MTTLSVTDPVFRLQVLEQKFDVLSNEINGALKEYSKVSQMHVQMSTAASKVFDTRLNALEQFVESVRAAIQDLNWRLRELEKPTPDTGIIHDGNL